MDEKNRGPRFCGDGVSFSCLGAAMIREIYMPLSAPDAAGIKSAVTPFLSGDIKIDKAHYLTKPVSRQDLRLPLRSVFVRMDAGDVFSSQDRETEESACVEAGPLWHKLVNRSRRLGLTLEVLNFVPVSGEAVELMKVTVRNESAEPSRFQVFGCIPVFGRSLVNKHDHEHVTSLLHRIEQAPQGVIVSPTMVFNEEGHSEARVCYCVFGAESNGADPKGSFPTVESFLGDSGTWERPEAVFRGRQPAELPPVQLNGKECAGALVFDETVLQPGESGDYIVMIGAAETREATLNVYQRFNTGDKVDRALEACRSFWTEKSGSITFHTADASFDCWMRWVMLQPVLRRIYGCSFLPDHDYGKGGKGWRDLWQDLLSLILIEPQGVRSALIGNFGGVRVDGTNATIIGSAPGAFIADRNAITRVWMDHGAWPVLTVMLYIDQTGDTDIIFEEIGYFRDAQFSRARRRDGAWRPSDGNSVMTGGGGVYKGTVLEHLLVQSLTQFFNVGEHNVIRLESADWNDGLDMAFERGESAAFSSLYAANLNRIADLVQSLQDGAGIRGVDIFQELDCLLDDEDGVCCDYDDIQQKQRLLFDVYFPSVEPRISGEKVCVECGRLIRDLRRKAEWIFEHIRKSERIRVEQQGKTYQWFNGYYDNQGRQVEGEKNGRIRMTLTGQVFSVMSGLADEQDVRDVVLSVNRFLKDELGGPRLNTDFGLRNYLDLGRAFSFAYGTKENGAVFCHMAVMYAYALYHRGFAREGFEVIRALYAMSADFGRSKMYPNLPEYFDALGKGMYSYLTGSASWLVLTLLTQVFGVRGHRGDLILAPRLVLEQFDAAGLAEAASVFAGKQVRVRYVNPGRYDFGMYRVGDVRVNGCDMDCESLPGGGVRLSRSALENMAGPLEITVNLAEKNL